MSAPAIVIGAGVNELVCAHILARAGHRVLVLDRRAVESDAGFESGWVPPRLVRELGLDRHGLAIHRPDPWAAAVLPDGNRLELWQDMTHSVAAIRRLSPRDAEKWPAFCERMGHLARLLETLYLAPPPDPMGRQPRELARLASVAVKVRRLGRQGVEDLLRLLPVSVADLLDDWFESDALKGILGAAGVMHLQQGPRSGGTAFRLLHYHVGSPAGMFRPPLSNMRYVLTQLPGIEIRRGADAARIVVRAGRVTGIVLANGDEIAASLVASGADAHRTLLGLIDPVWLDPDLIRAVKNVRCRGAVARVTLASEQAPGFTTLVVAPSLDYLEHAHDDAKYGRVSRLPYLELRSGGPDADGRHRADVHVQYAPFALADGGWDDVRRVSLGRLVIDALSLHLPEYGSQVVECDVLTPRDLEDACDFPEGQAHHAELTLDQALWMRPVPALARYRTPVAGLYLCGPGMHPGAGIAGASGANAARVILRDFRGGRLHRQSD